VLAGVLFDFHHVAFAVPAISTALYATVTRRNRLLWLGVAVGLLTREDVSLTLMALGAYIVLVQRRVRLGGALIAIGGSWFAAVVGVVVPALAAAPYQHWTYQQLGSGPLSAALYVMLHPLASLELLWTPHHKAKIGIGLVGNWLFLPVLSPLGIVAIPSLLERFWSSEQTLWSFSFHYSMLVGPILAFAAIDTVARAARYLPVRASIVTAALTAGTIAVGLLLSFGLVRPLDELGTYVSDARAAQIESCLAVIPPAASVSASSRLVPHLSDRRQIYMITAGAHTRYLAIDLSTEKVSPEFAQYLRDLIRKSLASGYGVACSRGPTAVLEQGRTGGSLSPQMSRFVGP